jgi:hypothetical protein
VVALALIIEDGVTGRLQNALNTLNLFSAAKVTVSTELANPSLDSEKQ